MRAVALALLGLLACSTGEGAVRHPAVVKIAIEGMRFAPAEVVATRGDTVVWTNNDLVAHTVTSKTGAFDSKVIPPGATWKYVVRRKGEFAYICSFHPMTATLRVR